MDSVQPITGTMLTMMQCVFEVNREKGGLTLTELAPGIEVDEIKKKTGAKFAIADNIKSME
jgi:3-oxoacid CoA-transferase